MVFINSFHDSLQLYLYLVNSIYLCSMHSNGSVIHYGVSPETHSPLQVSKTLHGHRVLPSWT